MMRKMIFSMVVLGSCTFAAGQAQAQFLKFGPNGSVGIRNGVGTYTYIHPNRMNPWANMAVPGTMTNVPNGQVWKGWDGQLHGNLVDPSTGDFHAFRHDGAKGQNKNNQFLIEPSGAPRPRPRQAQPMRNLRWNTPHARHRWP